MKIHTQRRFVPELLMVVICLAGAVGFLVRPSGGAAVSLELKSTDFTPGGNIPKQFTCEGANISPVLKWNDPPAAAQSFVMIADDPDAPVGTWVHWGSLTCPRTCAPSRKMSRRTSNWLTVRARAAMTLGKSVMAGPVLRPANPTATSSSSTPLMPS